MPFEWRWPKGKMILETVNQFLRSLNVCKNIKDLPHSTSRGYTSLTQEANLLSIHCNISILILYIFQINEYSHYVTMQTHLYSDTIWPFVENICSIGKEYYHHCIGLTLDYLDYSTIPHLPGCFCHWTFFENIGFNTVLTDPFMSHLATQLGYSTGEFQALQLIVLAAFGVVD